jgi:copper chaperone CopZ
MISHKIIIENLKCHGCANTIKREVGRIEGVAGVSIGFDDYSVTFKYKEGSNPVDKVKRRLKALGYPEQGSNTTFNKAKSYVSCAIGRVTPEKEG